MHSMSLEDESILDLIDEDDFIDIGLVNRVASRVIPLRDVETTRILFGKLHFPFLARDEGYRIGILAQLYKLSSALSISELFPMCLDTLVGNYLFLLALSRKEPILNTESIKELAQFVPYLQCLEDVGLFGFPYAGDVILGVDERIEKYDLDEINRIRVTCSLLLGLRFFHNCRETVDSFQKIYSTMKTQDFNLRAQLISAMLKGDFNQFSLITKKFGFVIDSPATLIKKYGDVMNALERLSIPVFFEVNNLRFNRVIFNDNFYFLVYRNFEGKDKIVYPFAQTELSEVSKIYDPQAGMFYTPKERYGRLLLRDIYSFREAIKIDRPETDVIAKITSMIEDDIKSKLREVLKDANRTPHSPVELADVLTLNLFVNNTDDLRLSGFIIKGQSFGNVHLNDIAGQLLQVSHSAVDIVFLVHIPSIDDKALQYFIQECEEKQKNYCLIDRNDLARILMIYKAL